MALREMVTTEPTWAIAELFPSQGMWDAEEYLALETNRLVEFSDGYLEVLSMPSELHQDLVLYLWLLLRNFTLSSGKGGKALTAPLPVYLWRGKYREPDVVYMLPEHRERRQTNHWNGADLVMEVVSPDNPRRDTVTKRREYAEAGIPEYWIIDPRTQEVAVLTLVNNLYQAHGVYGIGEVAESCLLDGFVVDVAQLFAQAG